MAAPRRTWADREREARESAQRDARRSLRLGAAGIVLLFVCGLGAWLLTGYLLAFVAGMVVAVLLILGAFLLVRGSVQVFKPDDETKIY